MGSRLSRDLVAGVLLFAVGAFVIVHALVEYPLGSLRQMGPGFFPLVLGVLLAGLGLMVGQEGLRRQAEGLPGFDVRPFLAVIASMLVFALLVVHFGLLPAVAAMIIPAVLAEDKLGVVGTLFFMVIMVVVTYVLFSVLLRLTIPMYRWPF